MARQDEINQLPASEPMSVIPLAAQAANASQRQIGDVSAVRSRIIREATRLFAQKGYNGVSVREIVEAAKITKPALYYYYPSKEHLFEWIILDTLEQFRHRLEEAVAQQGSMRDRLLRICRTHLEFSQHNVEQCRLVHSIYFSTERNVVRFDLAAYHRRNFETVCDVIAQGIESKHLCAGDPWAMTLVFIGAIHMFIMAILHEPSALPQGDIAEMVVDSFLEGHREKLKDEG